MKTRMVPFFGIVLTAVVGLLCLYANFTQAGALASVTIGQQGPGGRGPGGGPPGPGGPRGGPGGPEFHLFSQLDLTAAQQEQIKSLHEAERTAAQPIHEQLRQIHEELLGATKDGAFEEAAVRAIAAREAQASVELTVLHLKTQAAIYNVLTAEQKAKLAQLRENMRKDHSHRPGEN
ncbi:MAG TPA: Spy/CpxP family protein refolding chaperone [Blastocatellia bacterium]|nr:Spy/CpxP family protein refolding chaperone [Blastocatellia bacterium]